MMEGVTWSDTLHVFNYLNFWLAVLALWCWRRTLPWSSSAVIRRQSSHRRLQPHECHANYAFLRQSSDKAVAGEDMLVKSNPSSTHQERQRFLIARNGCIDRASAGLCHYLQWRCSHHSNQECFPKRSSDTDDWNWATKAAILAREQPSKNCNMRLPQIARMYRVDNDYVRDLKGNRIIHILPGQMDDRVVALETFSLAVALYIDLKLDRHSREKVTVMIDARGGQGWRNLNAVQLLPFIKQTSQLLLTLFPERLAHAQVYPVPHALGWVWRAVSVCIDPLTRDKISLLTGPAKIISPPPFEQMKEYLAPDIAQSLERTRVSEFCTM